MSDSINGDLSIRVSVDANQMDWASSPSGSVWRKRLHLVGQPESGQVTSIVRYEPNSRFPAHDHPEGEEILVLEGIFSDEHGDWPAGTYLLNPEGFRHAPFSENGCLLFVKLRQFAGQERRHVAVDTHRLEWEPTEVSGIACKVLYEQTGFADMARLERWESGADLGVVAFDKGAELFVLEGAFNDEEGTYAKGSWIRLPAGSTLCPRSASGCTLYIKTSGISYLRSATDK